MSPNNTVISTYHFANTKTMGKTRHGTRLTLDEYSVGQFTNTAKSLVGAFAAAAPCPCP